MNGLFDFLNGLALLVGLIVVIGLVTLVAFVASALLFTFVLN